MHSVHLAYCLVHAGFPDSAVDSWVGKIPWRRDRLSTPGFLGFPGGSAGKESTCNAGDLGLIPGLGRSPEEGKGYPLQYSGLQNSVDCIVHGVTESRVRLSDFHFYWYRREKTLREYCFKKKNEPPKALRPVPLGPCT